MADRSPLATSDDRIQQRTGRGWEAWFDLLDAWGAAELPHKEIARRVAAELGIEPLAWNAQAIAGSYERACGLRVVGQRVDGFAVTVQRTVAVPVEQLFEAFVNGSRRARWLPGADLCERTATKPKAAHFDWGAGETRVHVSFAEQAAGRSTVVVEHARLTDAAQAEQMKAFWRERLTALKAQLAGGGSDA